MSTRERVQGMIQSLSSGQVSSILNEMTPDDRARLFEELPADVTRRLLDQLSPEELRAQRILEGLEYWPSPERSDTQDLRHGRHDQVPAR